MTISKPFRLESQARASRVRGTVPRAARPRRRARPPRAPRTSLSSIQLALAPTSRCPHCGRDSKTVQGICADCWGSKGGRQFWIRKHGPRTSSLDEVFGVDPLFPVLVLGILAAVVGALLWILG